MQCIHHIDGDLYNNDPANLAIVDLRGRPVPGDITLDAVKRAKQNAFKMDVRRKRALTDKLDVLLTTGASEDDPRLNEIIIDLFLIEQRLRAVA